MLKPAGRMVFSVLHPEMAAAGIEAKFERAGTEYRLGVLPYSVDDYLNRMADAGFRPQIEIPFEHFLAVTAQAFRPQQRLNFVLKGRQPGR